MSEIFDGPLADELRLDSGSEEEEESMSLEELRAILEETVADLEDDDPEEYERLFQSFDWSNDYTTFTGQPEEYSQAGECGPNTEGTDPLELFTHVWDDDIMKVIVAETNQYAWDTIAPAYEFSEGISTHSRLNDWVETSIDELYRLFAVMIFMSLNVRGRVSEYWSTGVLGMPGFRSLMSIKRYWLLMRFLHFINNNDINSRGSNRKVAKIQSIIDHCNRKFNNMYTPRREICIDESLMLFKGRLSWIQCIRSKAARFGIKFYELCEAVTGYLLKFEVYTGKQSSQTEASVVNSMYGFTSASAKVVLRLMQGFLHKGHCLVMDNFYNSVKLARFLKSNKTDVIGTLNRRRMGTPGDIQIINEKRLQKGTVVARHCGDVSVLSWKDVKLVTTVSTYHNADMRPGRRAGQDILKPLVVHDYNKYMGGVDLKDQKLSMYLMERKRGIKWYMKVFKRLMNVSILNTYIIHRENSTNPLSHRQFRYKLAEQLVQRYSNFVILRVINPPAILRLDRNNHFPIYANSLEDRVGSKRNKIKRNRCVRCSIKKIRKEVNTMCQKCQIFICLGQCWIDYHTDENL